ncbi:MAG: patatin-like phospholipase family protein, partial [Tissierellales bacterium]|nr:patatin-like phospholipase family protein [Tissierellales bacterium]
AVAGTSIGAINGALFVQGDFDLAFEKWINANVKEYLNSSDDNPVTLFLSAVKEKGIDTAPLKEIMKNTIDEDKIRNSEIDYGLVTFSLSDMKPFMVMKKDIPTGELIDYIMASSAFPLFKTPEINGKKYIDGAVYDNSPAPLLANNGCKNIIIVDISGIGVNRNYTAEGLNIESLHRIKNSYDICGVLEFNIDNHYLYSSSCCCHHGLATYTQMTCHSHEQGLRHLLILILSHLLTFLHNSCVYVKGKIIPQ